MVSSTEIPNAILNTNMVDGFIGTPKYPIKPAVINNGKMFGINEIKIILNDLNINAIKTAISIIANDNEITKLFIKKVVPFKNISAPPVIDTL